MSYAVELTVPTDVLDAMNDRLIQSPTLMARGFRRAMLPIGRRAVDKLSAEPGAPQYPLRVTSRKQLRKIQAMRRERGGGAYPRTHGISDGWQYDVEPLADGGTFSVFNNVPGVEFVQGDFAQPFNLDTGWVQAAPVLSAARDEAEDAAIEVWYTVSDPFAGVPY